MRVPFSDNVSASTPASTSHGNSAFEVRRRRGGWEEEGREGWKGREGRGILDAPSNAAASSSARCFALASPSLLCLGARNCSPKAIAASKLDPFSASALFIFFFSSFCRFASNFSAFFASLLYQMVRGERRGERGEMREVHTLRETQVQTVSPLQ